jgi:hypothetical protein
MVTPSKRENIQVRAFHSLYRMFRKREAPDRRIREEDFCEAIVATSDDAFDNAPQELIDQWIETYGSVKGGAHKREEAFL